VATAPGTALEFLAGNDLLDPALQAKKLHLMMHRGLNGPTCAAGAVAVDQSEGLEPLIAAGLDDHLQPVERLLDQGHPLFQVHHPVQRTGGIRGAGAAFCQAKRALRPSGFDLVAADLADHMRHCRAFSARNRPAALPAANLDHLGHLQQVLLQHLQMLEIDHLKQHIKLGNVLHGGAGVQFHNISVVGADGGADFG